MPCFLKDICSTVSVLAFFFQVPQTIGNIEQNAAQDYPGKDRVRQSHLVWKDKCGGKLVVWLTGYPHPILLAQKALKGCFQCSFNNFFSMLEQSLRSQKEREIMIHLPVFVWRKSPQKINLGLLLIGSFCTQEKWFIHSYSCGAYWLSLSIWVKHFHLTLTASFAVEQGVAFPVQALYRWMLHPIWIHQTGSRCSPTCSKKRKFQASWDAVLCSFWWNNL